MRVVGRPSQYPGGGDPIAITIRKQWSLGGPQGACISGPSGARKFCPERRLQGPAAIALGEAAKALLGTQEARLGARQRRRSGQAERDYLEAIEAVVADIVHLLLEGHFAEITVPIGKDRAAGLARYRAAASGGRLSDVLDATREAGLVAVTPGRAGSGLKVVTRMSAGPGMVELIHRHPLSLSDIGRVPPREVLILKGAKPKGGGTRSAAPLRPYKDTRTTSRMRAEVQALNEWLGRLDLVVDPSAWPAGEPLPDLSNRFVYRGFNGGSFALGGRLYGPAWIDLKSHLRGALRLAGEPLLLCDLAAFNPRAAYALDGYDVPEHEDLYALEGIGEEYRPGVKAYTNAALAARKVLSQWPGSVYVIGKAPRKVDAEPLPEGLTPRIMNAALRARHPKIAHRFGTGLGGRLMFEESCIVLAALRVCRERDLPALPIYDCIAVPASRAEEAKSVLEDAYRARLGATPAVRIKAPGDVLDSEGMHDDGEEDGECRLLSNEVEPRG